ncbi:hypothetical protein N752_25515 [Desulforamulus aquiferis]|nr:hypothetical protein N752_25515 [Desulforamulus aquiferis]
MTAAAGGIFVVHVRNERDLLEESIQEIFDLGRQTGVAPHISHLKVMGKENWGQAGRILNLFEEARREGLEAAFDQYPYPAGSTMLSILIPAHAHAGGPEALLARLRDTQTRAVLSRQMAEGLPGWENIATAAGWDGILVTGVPEGANKKWEGQSLANIALKVAVPPRKWFLIYCWKSVWRFLWSISACILRMWLPLCSTPWACWGLTGCWEENPIPGPTAQRPGSYKNLFVKRGF